MIDVVSVQSAAEKAHSVKKAGEGKKKASPKKKVQAAAVLTSIIPPLCTTAYLQCMRSHARYTQSLWEPTESTIWEHH